MGETSAPGSVEFPPPPARPRKGRGAEVVIAHASRAPSLFPSPEYDANADGILQPEERRRIHAEVPLSVLVSVDDNGEPQSMAYLDTLFERFAIADKVTYFLTGNYLEGRPLYQGGAMANWWAALAQESFVGLHGLTHAKGADSWAPERWYDEERTVMKEITEHVPPPTGWSWGRYPWGSRAPELVANEGYFVALERMTPPVLYDASLVVRADTLRPLGERDLPWPFTLDHELAEEVQLPVVQSTGRQVALGKHPIFEVPVYAWEVRNGGKRAWIPSMDLNYFELFPCDGEPSRQGLSMFEENLSAHYEGNRAPFHLGLHSQNYMADRICERATLEAMLDVLKRFAGPAAQIRFEAIPMLVSRLSVEP